VINKKTKVLIISSLGPRPYLGGIENVIDTLMNSKLKLSYDFFIFDTYREPKEDRSLFLKLYFALSLPFLCAFEVLKTKPDIIHIHFCSRTDFWKHTLCLFTSKLMRVKVIFHLHGGSFDTVYEQYPESLKFIVRRILSSPDVLIALSSYWEGFLQKITANVTIQVAPNPIDCNVLGSYARHTAEEIELSVVLIGCVGERKGHFDVVKAARMVVDKYPKAQFYFAGNDEVVGATDKLKLLAKQKGVNDNMHFLGPVFGEAKLKLLGESGVMILPSYAENMPISVLEGMAANKTVISTKVGAIPEVIIDNESGILIEAGDWESLANRIVFLFDNPRKAFEIGEKAGLRVRENWDVSKIAEDFGSMYQGLLKED